MPGRDERLYAGVCIRVICVKGHACKKPYMHAQSHTCAELHMQRIMCSKNHACAEAHVQRFIGAAIQMRKELLQRVICVKTNMCKVCKHRAQPAQSNPKPTKSKLTLSPACKVKP